MSAADPRPPARADSGRTFDIRTYGCQMNEHDSERIAGLFRQLRPSHPETEARARRLLEFLTLDHMVAEEAGNLSGGQMRLLEIGMALAGAPRTHSLRPAGPIRARSLPGRPVRINH